MKKCAKIQIALFGTIFLIKGFWRDGKNENIDRLHSIAKQQYNSELESESACTIERTYAKNPQLPEGLITKFVYVHDKN